MSTPSSLWSTSARGLAVALVLAATIPASVTDAQARAGGGFSSGSRGGRSFGPPAFTRTAPNGAAPIQRSETPQFNPSQTAGAARPRGFGFGSGLAAGLFGAALFGLFGGYGGFGALFQLLLIGGLVVLALRFFRNRAAAGGGLFRQSPAFAGAAGASRPMGGGGGPLGGAAAAQARRASRPVAIEPRDFDAFEAALVDVQTAYGREDLGALGRLATPEMVRHFERDLRENRARGVHNDVGDAKLLQGDLAESWSEGSTDYATVAMRFSLRDLMVERASGRIVGGDPSRPQQATELWTFRRDDRGPWLLSAIQQAA